MAKRTAHSVARSLKSKFKKLISLANLPKSTKFALKIYKTCDDNEAPPVTTEIAAAEESDTGPPGGLLPSPSRKVEPPAELEVPPQGLEPALRDINNGNAAATSAVGSKVASAVESTRADSVTCAPVSVTNGATKEHTGMSIPPGSELEQQLRKAVLGHRSLKTLEADADLQLGSLEDQAKTISQQIQGLQDTIKSLQSGISDHEQAAQITTLYNAIADLRKAEDDAWQRRQRLIRHMSGLYQDFRDEQCEFLDTIDTMLVEKELIPPQARSTSIDSHADSSITSECLEPEVDSTTIKNTVNASDPLPIEAKKLAALLNDFIAKRNHLGACEQRFDTKDDLFDRLEDSRLQQFEAGEMVETATEFDLYLYEETRQMTRDLIDAEAEYELSKAAAVAAGIQLRYSDLESGFVDDVDDGYRMSLERDMVEDCDRERIEDWLMEIEEKTCPTRYLSVRDFAGTGGVSDLGEGKALKEISLSDSVSLVAEGPSRRRIDKWRAQLA